MSTAALSNRIKGLLSFIDNSPSPYHVVENVKTLLTSSGFTQLDEQTSKSWSQLIPGGKYFVIRNSSSILAFCIGLKFNSCDSKSALKIIAAHTDSPCLRLKPQSTMSPRDGLVQVGVEAYGGGLWHTWFDRDLSVAGRIIYKCKTQKRLTQSLVNIKYPILRIPNLAIHLDRTSRDSGFSPNPEAHLRPILCTNDSNKSHDDNQQMNMLLLDKLLLEADLENKSDILAFDLCLYDTQKASLSGLESEFIQSARLDNLFMSYTSLLSLVETSESNENVNNLEDINMVALFDHEEVGSASCPGADSTLVRSTIVKILAGLGGSKSRDPLEEETILARSFLVSADMAHAAHPNYPDKHEENHRPRMGQGVVIKYNSNQRYATSSASAAFFKSVAHDANCPIQNYCTRNDMPCGSTVGPILASNLGIETIDVGIAQLSMHSIREMAAVSDVDYAVDTLSAFLRQRNLSGRLLQ